MNTKKIKEGIKYWSQLLLLPVYGFSFLMPRDKKIWLFGSTFGRRFADNPRYFYLYISKFKREQIKPIWISTNKEIIEVLRENGYEAYNRFSLKGIGYCLRGGFYFYDNYPKDISHWLSGGAVKVNLWHGVPLKKIQKDNVFDKIRNPGSLRQYLHGIPRRLSDEKPSHYILATSEYFEPVFSSAFGTKRVLINGYPRTDAFMSDTTKNVLLPDEERSLEEIQSKLGTGKKILLYMPTFRDTEKKFFETINLKKFDEFLEKENYVLCTKLHCKSKLKEAFERIQSPNIVVINPNADPYVFVTLSDALITDYSSIYFDYLLTEKPILFFCYDLEEYLNDSREMYFSYKEFTPGEKVRTQSDLEMAMHKLFSEDAANEKRSAIKQYAFLQQERNASEELYRQLSALIR